MHMEKKKKSTFPGQPACSVQFPFKCSAHRPIGNTNSCMISTVFTDVSLTKPEVSLILEGDSLFCAWDQEICDLQQINTISDS